MTKTKLLIGPVAALAALLLMQNSTAQDRRRGRRPADPETMFDRFDADGDGRITKDEIPEQARRFIDRFDQDGDGVVTKDEVSQRGKGGSRDRGLGRVAREPNQRFEKDAPKVGESLPDLTAYDAEGREFKLSSITKGHYTVLVFGCLT